MAKILSIFLLLTLGFGCVPELQINVMPEKVTLTTSDGIQIVADVYPASEPKKFAILLHMMPETKESWREFAGKLQETGYTSIAIDERGHGESTMDGTLNYKTFTDEQQQAKRLDAEAAFEYLKTQGATEENTVVVGASIGANLAIRFLLDHQGAKKAVALSPGLDYRGVTTADAIQKISAEQSVLLVASDDDTESFETIRELHRLNPDQTSVIERSGIGHGTRMFDADPTLMDRVIGLF